MSAEVVLLLMAAGCGALVWLPAYGLGHRAGYRQCESDATEIARLVRPARPVRMRATGVAHARRPGLVLAHACALADEGPSLRRGAGRSARARFPGRVLALPSRVLAPGWRDATGEIPVVQIGQPVPDHVQGWAVGGRTRAAIGGS